MNASHGAPTSREEATLLLRGPFGQQMRNLAASWVAPMFWGVPNDEGNISFRNGTVFVLDTGQDQIVVTAGHVYEGYLDARLRHPQVSCQLWDMRFDPEERLVCYGKAEEGFPDIATFRISQRELQQLGISAITAWPPLPPSENRGVFFAGFPGVERLYAVPNKVSFGVFTGFNVASSVSDRAIWCEIEIEHLIETPWHTGIAPPDYDLGGVSGAPLMTVVESGSLIFWRLGGIVCEAPQNGGRFVAARADYIRSDGSLISFDSMNASGALAG